MAGSENRVNVTALQESIEALRSEINELKNKPGHEKEVAELRADLQSVKDELAKAKELPAPPAPAKKEPHDVREKETAPVGRPFGFGLR